MELADVLDSKSSGSDTVRVRPPPPAPKKKTDIQTKSLDKSRLFDIFIVSFSAWTAWMSTGKYSIMTELEPTSYRKYTDKRIKVNIYTLLT